MRMSGEIAKCSCHASPRGLNTRVGKAVVGSISAESKCVSPTGAKPKERKQVGQIYQALGFCRFLFRERNAAVLFIQERAQYSV